MLDITFSQLTGDPLGTARRIYAHYGWPFSDDLADRITRWLAVDSHTKGSKHRYSLEQFDLSAGMVDEAFGADYLGLYGVAAEVPRG